VLLSQAQGAFGFRRPSRAAPRPHHRRKSTTTAADTVRSQHDELCRHRGSKHQTRERAHAVQLDLLLTLLNLPRRRHPQRNKYLLLRTQEQWELPYLLLRTQEQCNCNREHGRSGSYETCNRKPWGSDSVEKETCRTGGDNHVLDEKLRNKGSIRIISAFRQCLINTLHSIYWSTKYQHHAHLNKP
jgi:hypothetical protein